MTGKRQVTGSYKTVRRMTIVGAVLAAFLLVDGFVLFLTGGLNGDATPVFLFLGGSFATANRSSGTNLLIMGALLALVTFAGWWWLGRPLRARERDGVAAGDVATPGSGDQARTGPGNQRPA